MPDWIISTPDRAAYMDLRGDDITFDEAERLLGVIQPYYGSRDLERIVIDVRGLDPIPGAVDVFIVGIEAQATTVGIQVDVLREDRPLKGAVS
jgi:hypothetical protein